MMQITQDYVVMFYYLYQHSIYTGFPFISLTTSALNSIASLVPILLCKRKLMVHNNINIKYLLCVCVFLYLDLLLCRQTTATTMTNTIIITSITLDALLPIVTLISDVFELAEFPSPLLSETILKCRHIAAC